MFCLGNDFNYLIIKMATDYLNNHCRLIQVFIQICNVKSLNVKQHTFIHIVSNRHLDMGGIIIEFPIY